MRRRFTKEDNKKLEFAFNEIKPTKEEDWESIRIMLGSKFTIEALKEQSEKLNLETDLMSPTGKLILQRIKAIKDMALSGSGTKSKKMKKELSALWELIVLNVPQPSLTPSKKRARSLDLSDDDDDSFIHDCVIAPIVGPIEPADKRIYRIPPRQWMPVIRSDSVDVGDNFETKTKLDTKYSKIYASNQVSKKKQEKLHYR